MNDKYHIVTYGCQMNVSDSERLASTLKDSGFVQAVDESDADLIFVNSCSVRQKAIDRIWGLLRNIEARERVESRKIVKVLTGCVLPDDRPKFASRFDLFFPIKNLSQLPALLYPLLIKERARVRSEVSKTEPARPPSLSAPRAAKSPLGKGGGRPLTPISQSPGSEKHYLQVKPSYSNKFSAFVPIMTGCNAHCTYCAVPYTRGREVSRAPEEIIQEVESLISSSYKEITLLGQIINKYMVKVDEPFFKYLHWILSKHGADINKIPELQEPVLREKKLFKLHHLLAVIANLQGKFWLRFTSSHPKWFSHELINTIKRYDKLVEHIHLPAQSGSNAVLKRMLRPYKIDEYKRIISYIREQIPDVSITTDTIVGFCSETEEEFNETKELYGWAKYDMAYISQYSTRPGTTAQRELTDDVPHEIKVARDKELTKILEHTAHDHNKKYINKEVEVLVTSAKNGATIGWTRTSKKIKIATNGARLANSDLIGQFIRAKVTNVTPWSLQGEYVS